jgi:cold shock CspA family protein/ribosome-associated translation inhibitor RaiA
VQPDHGTVVDPERGRSVEPIRPASLRPTLTERRQSKETDVILEPIITFRGMDRSEALESEIRARIGKLETYSQTIMGCRVLIERAERHHEAGNRYHVRIDLTVPGEEVVVTHDATLHAAVQDIAVERLRKADEPDPAHKHALVAIRAAFAIGRRRLQDYMRRQRGTVKVPVRQPRGQVARLFPADGYGYIEDEGGREVYFQRSSVLKNAFDRLRVGAAVSFVDERGEKGPQASTVRLVRPRRTRRRLVGAAPAGQVAEKASSLK